MQIMCRPLVVMISRLLDERLAGDQSIAVRAGWSRNDQLKLRSDQVSHLNSEGTEMQTIVPFSLFVVLLLHSVRLTQGFPSKST